MLRPWNSASFDSVVFVPVRFSRGRPEVSNSDQGVQYWAAAFTDRLESAGMAISIDGRGRWLDNLFVERLWRTVKYEYIYPCPRVTARPCVYATGVGQVPIIPRV